jgi:hypothetical protein
MDFGFRTIISIPITKKYIIAALVRYDRPGGP